jgi:hypothetical protein
VLLAGFAWTLLIALAFFFRPALYGLFIVGALCTFVGRRMFLQVARDDGVGTWLACLLVPFYSTYYFFAHVDETLKPFLIGSCGYLFLASGGIMYLVHLHRETSAERAEQAEGPLAKPMLVLNVGGKEVSLSITEMNYFHVKRGRDEFPDSFEFAGEGTSIRGTFALGFEEDWEHLVGQPVTILARNHEPEEGDSYITLPEHGVVKVTGGSFVVEKLVRPGPEPVLRGRITLQLQGDQVPQSVQGTFEVSVNGWY